MEAKKLELIRDLVEQRIAGGKTARIYFPYTTLLASSR